MTTLAPYLAGPASAVVVLSLVLFAVYRIVDTRVIPAWEAAVKRHLDQVDRSLEAHERDREKWVRSLADLRADCDERTDKLIESLHPLIEVPVRAANRTGGAG